MNLMYAVLVPLTGLDALVVGLSPSRVWMRL